MESAKAVVLRKEITKKRKVTEHDLLVLVEARKLTTS